MKQRQEAFENIWLARTHLQAERRRSSGANNVRRREPREATKPNTQLSQQPLARLALASGRDAIYTRLVQTAHHFQKIPTLEHG